jgi:hypothetical protein
MGARTLSQDRGIVAKRLVEPAGRWRRRYRSIVDGGRGRPSARRALAGASLLALAAVGAGCTGSSTPRDGLGSAGTNATDTRAACALIQQLQHTADRVTAVPLSDPARSSAALRSAVADYVRTLDSIAVRVPTALRAKVELLRSAVQQYKFADAIDARVPLDDWAADHC